MDIWTCPTPLGLLISVQASVKILTKSPAVFGPSSCFAPNVGFCAHGVGSDNWTTQRVRRRKIAKKFLKASNIYLSSSFFLFFWSTTYIYLHQCTHGKKMVYLYSCTTISNNQLIPDYKNALTLHSLKRERDRIIHNPFILLIGTGQ